MTIENVHNIKEAFNWIPLNLFHQSKALSTATVASMLMFLAAAGLNHCPLLMGLFFRASDISLFCGSQKEANWLLNAKSDWQSRDKPEGKQVIHFELILMHWIEKVRSHQLEKKNKNILLEFFSVRVSYLQTYILPGLKMSHAVLHDLFCQTSCCLCSLSNIKEGRVCPWPPRQQKIGWHTDQQLYILGPLPPFTTHLKMAKWLSRPGIS